jgi:hypothetical protein
MTDADYWNRTYRMDAREGVDTLRVAKSSGNDWSHVSMTISGQVPIDITVRSKAMAEMLHSMLGQLLGK